MMIPTVGDSDPPSAAELSSFTSSALCRCCIGLCGIKVAVRDGQVSSVMGDADHPVSRGYTCPKGRSYPERHASDTRLSFPMMRGKRVSWEECLDDISSSMRRLVSEGGPEQVGFYIGTGSSTTDFAGRPFLQKMLGALGSQQFYSAASVDITPLYRAAELVTGFATVFPVWEPDDPQGPSLALVIGFNPVVSHGYANVPHFTAPGLRLRRFRERGGELWVIDPRRTETAALADRHMAIRPGTDAAVLAWLVRELLVDGADAGELADSCDPADVARLRSAVDPFDLDRVAALAGVSRDGLTELLDAIRRHRRIAVATGTGLSFTRHGVVTEWLVWALLIVTGSADRPGGMWFARHLLSDAAIADPAPVEGRFTSGPPSRPDLHGFAGERPAAAIVDEIEAGTLRGLFVQGSNPLTAFPNPGRVRASISQLELCVVVDVFGNEMTDLATHVLPAAWHLERADVFNLMRAMYTPAVVPIGAERKPAWWIHGQLAKRLGINVFGDAGDLNIDTCTEDDVLRYLYPGDFDQLKSAGTQGMPLDRRIGWVHAALPEGHWRLAPPVLVKRLPQIWERPEGLRLIPSRILRNQNSHAFRGNDIPPITVSAVDAAEAGLDEGDRVQVASSRGSLEGAVHIDSRIRPGVVSINHGWLEQNVGNLTDESTIDPLTGQPAQSDLRVELIRYP